MDGYGSANVNFFFAPVDVLFSLSQMICQEDFFFVQGLLSVPAGGHQSDGTTSSAGPLERFSPSCLRQSWHHAGPVGSSARVRYSTKGLRWAVCTPTAGSLQVVKVGWQPLAALGRLGPVHAWLPRINERPANCHGSAVQGPSFPAPAHAMAPICTQQKNQPHVRSSCAISVRGGLDGATTSDIIISQLLSLYTLNRHTQSHCTTQPRALASFSSIKPNSHASLGPCRELASAAKAPLGRADSTQSDNGPWGHQRLLW